MKTRRFLFVAHAATGHTQALRAIGRALLARGHFVRFALLVQRELPAFLPLSPALRSAAAVAMGVQADGFTVVPLRSSLASGWAAIRVASSRGYDELDWAMKLFSGDMEATARSLAAELAARPAELVVADCFHYAASLAAELQRTPFVAVFHSGLPMRAKVASLDRNFLVNNFVMGV